VLRARVRHQAHHMMIEVRRRGPGRVGPAPVPRGRACAITFGLARKNESYRQLSKNHQNIIICRAVVTITLSITCGVIEPPASLRIGSQPLQQSPPRPPRLISHSPQFEHSLAALPPPGPARSRHTPHPPVVPRCSRSPAASDAAATPR